jgi:type I restriction enzyme, S subunit
VKWPVAKLSIALESAEVFVDGDWVESKDQDPDGDVRLVQLADIGDGVFINKSDRFLTSAKARELRCTFLKPGDVLVARMPDPLGRACIFPGDPKPSVTVVDVCIIRPDPGHHDARWLMHCLNMPACRNQIQNFATGTTRSRISRSNLGKIQIPAVPLYEQVRIAEVLDRADALLAKRRSTLDQLDALAQSIFLDLFGDPFAQRDNTVRLAEVADILMGQSPPGSSYNTKKKWNAVAERSD